MRDVSFSYKQLDDVNRFNELFGLPNVGGRHDDRIWKFDVPGENQNQKLSMVVGRRFWISFRMITEE